MEISCTFDVLLSTISSFVPILICSVFLLWFFLQWRRRHPRDKRLPPGSMGWPYIGETLELYSQNPNSFFSIRQKRYSYYTINSSLRISFQVFLKKTMVFSAAAVATATYVILVPSSKLSTKLKNFTSELSLPHHCGTMVLFCKELSRGY